ncbi:hypothetical protein M378DRAFT_12872 [Amanita muscaria Koide BX008]|uniref:Uncharacterized protein n=1 Tax=Amanita muscaria (strain Koide BX008) TaxID=946122 RepID=A0A0C2X146_AMAMK|nr:hypothetical protein M378DRAFT_12872 [Amanita muscaria Koide BX008]
MRLPTVLVFSVFVLAGMSTAIPVEGENIVARFDFLADVKARAYGEELELDARGVTMSKLRNKDSRPPSYKKAVKEPPVYQRIPPSPTHLIPYQTDRSIRPPSYRSAWKDPVIMSNTRRPQRQGFRAEYLRTLNDMAL